MTILPHISSVGVLVQKDICNIVLFFCFSQKIHHILWEVYEECSLLICRFMSGTLVYASSIPMRSFFVRGEKGNF